MASATELFKAWKEGFDHVTSRSPLGDSSTVVDLLTTADVKSRHLAKVSGRNYGNYPSQGIPSQSRPIRASC